MALASILGAGLSLFLYYRYNTIAQIHVTLATALTYILWGILHHKLAHYLTLEIVFEYVLVAALGALAVVSMIA